MTLQFWMGAALASIVCWIFLWWFLSIGNKQAKRNDDKNGAANDLLAERNAIGRQQVEALSKIVKMMTFRPAIPLRDWIAGMALTGELASTSTKEAAEATAKAAVASGRTVEQQVAANCYRIADAMLAARGDRKEDL
mgnify:CR=1 FL=1